jgi:hypothetical protein
VAADARAREQLRCCPGHEAAVLRGSPPTAMSGLGPHRAGAHTNLRSTACTGWPAPQRSTALLDRAPPRPSSNHKPEMSRARHRRHRRSNAPQISCRPYEAEARTTLRFLSAFSDGAALTEPRAGRPVGCICLLDGGRKHTERFIGPALLCPPATARATQTNASAATW